MDVDRPRKGERHKRRKSLSHKSDAADMPAAPAVAEVSTARVELAKRTYDQVLDATKHQDDKVGRFLTAIAFLTTGSIAFGATDEGLQARYSVHGGGSAPLLAIFVGLFLFFTLASVVLFLLCLSVPVRQPQKERSARDRPRLPLRQDWGSMEQSRLFYSFIAPRPTDEWVRDWDNTCTQCLADSFERDYVRESHNLAERTSAKYRHSHEASWLFVIALLFLGISVALKIFTYVQDAYAEDDIVSLRTGLLSVVAMISFAHLSLQVYTRAVHDVSSMQVIRDHARADKGLRPININESERRASTYLARRRVGFMVVPAAVYLILLIQPKNNWATECWLMFVLIAGSIAAYRMLIMSRSELGPGWYVVTTVAMIAITYAVTRWATARGDHWLVAAMVLPPFLLACYNMARPAGSQHQTRRKVRKRAQESERLENTPLVQEVEVEECPACGARRPTQG